MALLDLSLKDLHLAGLANFKPEFGTKEPEGVSVSTENVCKDVMLPFTKQRPVPVVETSNTSDVEADTKLVFQNSGIILTLGRATFAGCRVEVYGGFVSGTAKVTFNKSSSKTETLVIQPKERIVLISDSENYFSIAERIKDGIITNTSLSISNLQVDKNRFVVFDFSNSNRRSIKFKKNTHIRLDITRDGDVEHRWFDVGGKDRKDDLSRMIATAAASTSTQTGVIKGRNYYIYLAEGKENVVDLVVSCNSTFPNDVDPKYNANNTRKIAQFHTLCADAGSSLTAQVPAASGSVSTGSNYLTKDYYEDDDGFYDFYNKKVKSVTSQSRYDVLTVEHPLAGFIAGDILPESIFCLTFSPHSNAAGMVYDVNTDVAADIYLQSGTGRNTRSAYNGTTTRSRQPINHQDDLLQVRKRLPTDTEFLSFALGSNEKTNIEGSTETNVVKAGGHKDTNGRRMISLIGCEECCGAVYQWLEVFGPTGGSGWATYDEHASFGQTYGTPYQLPAGGTWYSGAACGSRCRTAHPTRSNTASNCGARGVSHVECCA